MTSPSSTDSEPASRPTVRYEAQQHPSQGSRFAAEEQANAWVGAFERVLGDHAEQEEAAAAAAVSSADSQRKATAKDEAPTASSNTAASRRVDQAVPPQPKPSPRRQLPSRQRSKSHLRNAWVPSEQPSAPSSDAPTDQQMLHPASAAAASSSSSSPQAAQQAHSPSATRSTHSASSGTAGSSQHPASRLSHKGSNRALRPTAPPPAPPSSSTSSASTNNMLAPQLAKPAPIRSYGPAPAGEEDDDDDQGDIPEGQDKQHRLARKGQTDYATGSSYDWLADASLGLSRTASGPTMLEVSSRHQKDKIAFPDLYLNHAPGLQPLRLRNTLGHGKSVLVRLESDMGHAVTFMRRKRTAPKNELAKLSWPSNTLAWARGDGLSPQALRELRAISVTLEVADSLILEGGASTDVFVIFRPGQITDETGGGGGGGGGVVTTSSVVTSRPTSRASSSAAASPHGPNAPVPTPGHRSLSPAAQLPEPAMSTPSTNNVLSTSPHSASDVTRSMIPKQTASPLRLREVNGKVTIRAWQLPSLQPAPVPASNEDAGTATTSSSRSSTASSRPTSIHGGSTLSSGTASMSTAITDLSESEPQQVELPLLARFCRPQIVVSVKQPGPFAESDGTRIPVAPQRQGVAVADFGDVVAGEPLYTELTLANQSEIDCFWQCRVDCEADDPDAPPCVSISDVSTGKELDVVRPAEGGAGQYLPHVLVPHATMKLKLTLAPQHSGTDMEEIVTFTNLHNTSNSIRIAIRANVQARDKAPALHVASSDYLDFGDCCGGQWTRQLLIMRNVSDYSLDVTLNAQKGHEVSFQQAEVALDGVDDDGGQEEMHVGATAASSDGSSVVSDLALTDSVMASDHSSIGGVSSGDQGGLRPSPPAVDLQRSPLESYTNAAMELIRTPTHHASLAPNVDPPTFDLGSYSGSSDAAVDLERTPVVLTPFAHPPAPAHQANEDDAEDNSSIASQAGSRPTSPAPAASTDNPVPSISELDGQPGSVESPSVAEQSTTTCVAKKDRTKNSVLAWREANKSSEMEGVAERDRGSFSTTGAESAWTDAASSVGRKDDEALSVTSEVTSHSQGNRSVVLSAHSRAGSSALRGSRAAGAGGTLRSVEIRDSKDLDELTLRPGEEVRVIVSFRPARGDVDETFSAGRLAEHTFRLILDHTRSRNTSGGGTSTTGHGSHLRPRPVRERKVVLCRIRTCTSFITVSPAQLDFGEVNVGTRKTGQIEVFNHSDLSARVDLRFVSKVLSMYRDEMAIPANQSIHLSVDYSPRRVNTAYSKQITVANLLNRHNDQIVEVRGKNVDKQRISFHSLFYRILTPDGSNFLEFGDVNINSSRVRTFSIENTSKASLTLDITTAHPEDVALYVKATAKAPSSVAAGSEADGSSQPSQSAVVARATKGYEDVEPSTIAKSTVSRALSGDSNKPSNVKGTELKERFLESISSDTPANVRQENTSWRTAQQLSHIRKGAAPASALGSSKEGTPQGSSSSKAKSAVNLVSALKKGGKGRITLLWGKSVTFKDRSLLQTFEWLDPSSGPPLTANRISVKSKCFQMLDQIEAGSKGKNGKERTGEGATTNTGESGQTVHPEKASTSSSPVPPSTPTKPKQGIPAPLARDIRSKAGTPSKTIARQLPAGSSDRSPALTGKKRIRQTALEPGDVANLSLDELLSALESQPSSLSSLFFNSAQAEEKHVRTEINLLRELRHVVETKQLEPLEMLEVAPGEERQVVAIYCPNGSTRPHIQGTARKQDSRIFLRLVDFDVDAVRASEEFAAMSNLDKDELPIRDLMVRTTTCRALLELGQPHINFGAMEKGESKTRKILIHNRSEWAARYCIRKSGSIASGDIKLSSGRYGVVSAHGKREVEFVFSPSLTGPFQEKLVIENVADRDRDLTVFLKAHVRKKPNFTVEPKVIDFGDCKPGKLAEPRSFTVSNTTGKARTFVVAVDSSDLRHQRTIMDLVFTASSDGDSRSKAEDASIADEIEHLSQKLKIATRKGHEDKVKKYESRLSELGVSVGGGGGGGSKGGEGMAQERSSNSGSAGDAPLAIQAAPAAPEPEEPASSRLKRVSSTVTVGLAANQSKRITVRLRTSAVHTALTAKDATTGAGEGREDTASNGEDVSLNVQIHEVKNQDETINVTVRARALWAAPSASPPPTLTSALEAEAGMDADAVSVVTLPPSVGGHGLDQGGEEEDVDPLPTDASAIIFTSNTQ